MNSSAKLIACLFLFANGFPAHAVELRSFEAVEPHMGTLIRIKLFVTGEGEAAKAFNLAFARIAQIDAALTDYQPESELNRMCRNASVRPVHVSDDLFAVLSKAQEVAEATSGAFDVTIGPITHVWRAAKKTGRIPDAAELRNALSRCGYRKLHLNRAARTVCLDQPGMQIDLGGIAKGYAADQALKSLRELGVKSALVAASGDLTFSDPPPHENGWKVGVDAADRATAPFTRILLLANAAVSTSGDTEQSMQIKGTRHSHIVDPKTGEGLTSSTTATVIARTGIDADATATAIDVLGTRAGLAYVESHPDLAALFVQHKSEPVQVLASRRFQLLQSTNGGTP